MNGICATLRPPMTIFLMAGASTIWVSCGNVGVWSVTVFNKIKAVEIKVITYQDEIGTYEFVFFLTTLLCVSHLGPFWVTPHEYVYTRPI